MQLLFKALLKLLNIDSGCLRVSSFSQAAVKLLNINNLLDKWYLRKTLRRDLKALLPELSNWENPIFGDVEYTNQSRGIVYSFKLLNKENETGE